MNKTPGACIINLFTAIINSVAIAFAIVSRFLLALTNTLAFYITDDNAAIKSI
jgi:hypothetical protein